LFPLLGTAQGQPKQQATAPIEIKDKLGNKRIVLGLDADDQPYLRFYDGKKGQPQVDLLAGKAQTSLALKSGAAPGVVLSANEKGGTAMSLNSQEGYNGVTLVADKGGVNLAFFDTNVNTRAILGLTAKGAPSVHLFDARKGDRIPRVAATVNEKGTPSFSLHDEAGNPVFLAKQP
jgi:hypothetical protein